MRLATEPYQEQSRIWPTEGRRILAQFDDETIVVYQAYRPSIGHFAAQHGHFGGEFGLSRMSWIKPGFMWMMYRSGWGTKVDQEVVLAVWLKRWAFEAILAQAVQSTFSAEIYGTEEDWKRALMESSVRLQWDPDHDPRGTPLKRRAIQLGLRGDVLAQYARNWIVAIEDISDFVREQYGRVEFGEYENLVTPRERVYPVTDDSVARQLGIGAAKANDRSH